MEARELKRDTIFDGFRVVNVNLISVINVQIMSRMIFFPYLIDDIIFLASVLRRVCVISQSMYEICQNSKNETPLIFFKKR